MRYRNRVVFGAAWVGVVTQPVAVVYALLTMEAEGDGLVNAAALLSMASLFAWLFVRIGVQPSISTGEGFLSVHNPLYSYRARLSDVQFVARGGAFGLRVEGIGAEHPWVLSKSVFDGRRARSARKELRELIGGAVVAPTEQPGPSARRWIRWGRLIFCSCRRSLSPSGTSLTFWRATKGQGHVIHYRNRAVYVASMALTLAMLVTAVYFLFLDSGAPSGAWDVVLALAVPCAVVWVLVRTGLTPYVEWGAGRVTVCNPFVVYSAPLSEVRLLGRAEKGGAFDVAGVGQVSPWALTRSVFDGRRANEARRELRHAVLRAHETEQGVDPGVTRRVRAGWYDVLLLPFLAACVWAFLP
ncbi:hypothetical protein QNN03_08785 [Streptomyces sp. GXMU-J15]|uniref:PH domain-containing protein n=2 Tax=Streptomyces TaxID=1883 RepID=A0ABT7IVC7_9ACTN|nr:hypothetical protein [Streptomyces fuscus]MDL2076530.1 hypothetical protein [Streptomyces fuscus]